MSSGIGLTFAAGLRSILRHDPDVILIGEDRTREAMAKSIEHLSCSGLYFDSRSIKGTRIEIALKGYQYVLTQRTGQQDTAELLIDRVKQEDELKLVDQLLVN